MRPACWVESVFHDRLTRRRGSDVIDLIGKLAPLRLVVLAVGLKRHPVVALLGVFAPGVVIDEAFLLTAVAAEARGLTVLALGEGLLAHDALALDLADSANT